MAETDELYEFGREPGFSSQFFERFLPWQFSYVTRVIPEVFVLPWMFPGGSSCPRCPEGQDVVPLCQMAQNPQDCTYGSDLFVMMILVCFSLSCDGLLAVFVTINCLQSKTILRLGFVMEDNVYSLCLGIFIIVHSWIIQYLISENRFVNHNHICLVFLTIIWLGLHHCFRTLHLKFLVRIV